MSIHAHAFTHMSRQRSCHYTSKQVIIESSICLNFFKLKFIIENSSHHHPWKQLLIFREQKVKLVISMEVSAMQ